MNMYNLAPAFFNLFIKPVSENLNIPDFPISHYYFTWIGYCEPALDLKGNEAIYFSVQNMLALGKCCPEDQEFVL